MRDFAGLIAVAIVFGFAAGRIFDGPAGLLVALAATILLIAAVWWVRGRRGWRIDEEVVVAAPPSQVWRVLDDPSAAARLDPRISHTDVVGGEGVGRRERHHGRLNRKDVAIESVVAERDEPRRLVQDIVALSVDGAAQATGDQRQAYELEPVEQGTRVRFTVTGSPAGAKETFALGARLPAERRMIKASLRRLADAAGGQPPRA